MKQFLSSITPIQWLGIIILFNTTLIGGASQLQDLFLSVIVVKAILAAATLGNGFLGGLVTMFGSQAAQVKAVSELPGVEKVLVNTAANVSLATQAVDKAQNKIEPVQGAAATVQAIAKGAA